MAPLLLLQILPTFLFNCRDNLQVSENTEIEPSCGKVTYFARKYSVMPSTSRFDNLANETTEPWPKYHYT